MPGTATTQALHDISLTMEANHATALIGPSGCGKSTFIRCLNRMHETTPEARVEGKVKIGDLDAYDGTSPDPIAAPHRHGISKAESVSHHVYL